MRSFSPEMATRHSLMAYSHLLFIIVIFDIRAL